MKVCGLDVSKGSVVVWVLSEIPPNLKRYFCAEKRAGNGTDDTLCFSANKIGVESSAFGTQARRDCLRANRNALQSAVGDNCSGRRHSSLLGGTF